MCTATALETKGRKIRSLRLLHNNTARPLLFSTTYDHRHENLLLLHRLPAPAHMHMHMHDDDDDDDDGHPSVVGRIPGPEHYVAVDGMGHAAGGAGLIRVFAATSGGSLHQWVLTPSDTHADAEGDGPAVRRVGDHGGGASNAASASAPVTDMVLNPHMVLMAAEDGCVRAIPLDEKRQSMAAQHDREERIRCSALAVHALCFQAERSTPTDKFLAAVGTNEIQQWDLGRSGTKKHVHSFRDISNTSDIVTTIAVHPSKPDVVVTGSTQGWVSFWDLRKTAAGRPMYRQPPPPPQSSMASQGVLKMVFDLKEGVIAGYEDGQIMQWTQIDGALEEASNLYSKAEMLQNLLPSQTPLAVNALDILRGVGEPGEICLATGGDGGLWYQRPNI